MDLSDAPAGYLLGIHEKASQAIMERYLTGGAVYYDLGANVGSFVLIGARLVGPGGRVVAFEPVPANAAVLHRNTRLNGFNNVTVVETAVSGSSGTRRMSLGSNQSHSISADGDIDVPAVSIDDYIHGGGPPPDLVKIDVEGEEVEVVRGMRRTIERHQPAILCESHTTGPLRDDPVAAQLQAFGYRVTWLEGGEDPGRGPFPHLLAVPA